MNFRRIFVLAITALLAISGSAASRAADDPLSYSDPGMHFQAPDGWERLPIQDQSADRGGTPVAAYILKKNKYEQRVITIVTQTFTGPLEAFEHSHVSDLRQQGDSTYIEKQEKTALSNGMPAYWLKVNQGANLGQYVRRYEYLVIDLSRGIIVSYVGRAGDFDEKDAKAALSSLYVVVYPKTRR
jgi:hypothetical protein